MKELAYSGLAAILILATYFLNRGDNLVWSYLISIPLALYLLWLPGRLVVKLYDSTINSHSLYFSIGIVAIMTVFLLSNLALIAIGVTQPFNPLIVAIIYIVSLATLNILSLRSTQQHQDIPWSEPIKHRPLLYLLLLGSLTSAITGPILINNNATYYIALATVAINITIVAYSLLAKNLHTILLKLSVYTIALSSVLLFTMRSGYLLGFDIQYEFAVFQRTLTNQFWTPTSVPHGYNATLPVNILPVVIHQLTNINDYMIFKFLYPALFALVPVLVFKIIQQYLPSKHAFLGALVVIVQLQFMQQLPAIARQEIAMLMFAALIYSQLANGLSKLQKWLCFLPLAFGLVISHYSTTYMTIAIIVAGYLVYKTAKILFKTNITFKHPTLITLPKITLLITFAIFWYGVVNPASSKYLLNFAQQTVNSVFRQQQGIFSEVAMKSIKKYSYNPNVQEQLNSYIQTTKEKYNNELKWVNRVPDQNADKTIILGVQQYIPVRDVSALNIANILTKYLSDYIKILVIIGLCIAITQFFRGKLQVPFEVLSWSGISTLIIVATLIIPTVSLFYNVERVFQQMLVILPLVMMLVLATVASNRLLKYALTSVYLLMLAVLYSANTGAISQILGGGPFVTFNNFGETFERFYIYPQEQKSATWLNHHKKPKAIIQADQYAELKLAELSFDTVIINDLIPGTIDQNSYVYLSHANVENNETRVSHNGTTLLLQIPFTHMEENKDSIYNNGNSKIYK